MEPQTTVVALDFDFGDYQELLRGFLPPTVKLLFRQSDSPDLLTGVLPSADVLLVGWSSVPRRVLEAAPRLRLLQTTAIGVNHIDLDAAAELGVPVANAAGSSAVSVAEHTLLLILAVYRRLIAAHTAVNRVEWPQAALYREGLFELSGKTVGVIGFGDIGQSVARLLSGFNVRTLYFRRRRLSIAQETALAARYATLERLLAESDVVTLHLPLSEETAGLLGRSEIARMKRSAILINTSRGAVVDEPALIDALRKGAIAGAGLDVLAQEPIRPGHPLLELENVVLTPHVAGNSREAIRQSIALASQNILRIAQGRRPVNVVTS